MRWQNMADGKEKYAAYLCSREWSQKKEAVRARSGGLCERCTLHPMDHVHHLTYERKYAELLDDLQACCKPCHEFIHAKSDYDPAADRPVVIPWCKRRVKAVYLAGKITGTTWRAEFLTGWSSAQSIAFGDAWFDVGEDRPHEWCVVANAVDAGCRKLHYCGPWWKDFGCGHGSSSDNEGPHAYGDQFQHDCEDETSRAQVANAVSVAVSSCDMLFAWIDSADCFGTLFEIGLARGLQKVVVIAVDEEFQRSAQALDMWLAFQGCYVVSATSAKHGWDQFWELVEFESPPSKTVTLHEEIAQVPASRSGLRKLPHDSRSREKGAAFRQMESIAERLKKGPFDEGWRELLEELVQSRRKAYGQPGIEEATDGPHP